jgi:cytoskeletal protein RodZ
MEEDDFSHCGGDVYARGQLKSIAAVVGLDPDDVVDSYDAGH